MTMRLTKMLLPLLLVIMMTAQIESKGGAAVAAAAVAGPIINTLDGLSSNTYGDSTVKCFWNDWKSRDAFARTQRVSRNGRWSHQRKFWGINIGRWYCSYYQSYLRTLGWAIGN